MFFLPRVITPTSSPLECLAHQPPSVKSGALNIRPIEVSPEQEIIQVREADNVLLIKGAIPGASGDYVIIRESKKRPKTAAKAK